MKKLFGYAAILATAYVATSQASATNLLGIDVSAAQGSINWTSVHGAGVEFAFAQATEGNYFQDSKFKSYMTNGKAAGVQMGAAHFARPDLNTPATEANYFWSFAGPYIKADGKSISPAVEFETFNGHVGASTYTAWFNAWAADVKAKTTNSMTPVIYVSSCAGACYLDTSIMLDGWIANYNGENLYTGNPWTSCLCNPWGPTVWDYWQVTSTGSIPGISGNVDLDAFNGTLAKLKSTEGVGGL
ncbi:glycoside hydrolase family 25 protein [Pedosphaera parvula]|uniref:Glycoside hydrolase family 25 n=1 Tax=Pedosphaera parvula (strain Ellin514) TaxID=320771 RepID=B9XHD4_PEDPL|nr:glycoside hydrolase family 25 protein [Pedosphaera parvula]EEF60769.1 glycoside hydrolase family 25 [Pedosphaera parvula Ellin514]